MTKYSGKNHHTWKGYWITPYGKFETALQSNRVCVENGDKPYTRKRVRSNNPKWEDWYFQPKEEDEQGRQETEEGKEEATS